MTAPARERSARPRRTSAFRRRPPAASPGCVARRGDLPQFRQGDGRVPTVARRARPGQINMGARSSRVRSRPRPCRRVPSRYRARCATPASRWSRRPRPRLLFRNRDGGGEGQRERRDSRSPSARLATAPWSPTLRAVKTAPFYRAESAQARDLAVLLARTLDRPRVLDAMAGSGVRSARVPAPGRAAHGASERRAGPDAADAARPTLRTRSFSRRGVFAPM